jgi:hypothetical protein
LGLNVKLIFGFKFERSSFHSAAAAARAAAAAAAAASQQQASSSGLSLRTKPPFLTSQIQYCPPTSISIPAIAISFPTIVCARACISNG